MSKCHRSNQVVKEIGSRVNDTRPKFLALCADSSLGQIVGEHKWGHFTHKFGTEKDIPVWVDGSLYEEWSEGIDTRLCRKQPYSMRVTTFFLLPCASTGST